jgi:hypothetical protein
MKRKVKVKSLPKAQYGFNNLPAPKVLRSDYLETWQKNNPYPAFGTAPTIPTIPADVYAGSNNTTGNFNVGMPSFERNVNPFFYADAYQGNPNTTGSLSGGTDLFEKAGNTMYADVYQGDPNTTGNFNVGMPEFNREVSFPSSLYPTKNNPLSLYPKNTKLKSGILSTNEAIRKSYTDQIPEDTRKLMGLEPYGDLKPKKFEQETNNPYVGPMLLAGTDAFSSIARKIQDRNAKSNYRNEFLSDNLYNVRPEDYPGNRGDYLTNTPGLGPDFRPTDYIYGDYNKIAQMGGEMKRKVKITSLPQAGYGGTQDAKAVNQLYGNSAYMMNMFNGATKGEPEEQYGQTLQPDPRSMSVLEAEKGETLIRKGTNSTIPEFFTIGGKRHSEGGTPLSGEKATPDSFIYSDTKAMKIKDPAILESFGFKTKKGGYTPAKISKKFDLNNKDLREGLYSENDPLRKKTAVMVADNYISNLGKLALVQESQKGFPQGVPEIAMPYMDKIGLDPAQFLPPSPEEGMAMAMYGGMPKAQTGGQSNIKVNRKNPYTANDIEFKDGRWQIKPTANMQAAPYSVSAVSMSPQRFQDYTFNDPEAAIDLVIKSSGIPSYLERVDKGRQEFLNSINKPFATQQQPAVAQTPKSQPVVQSRPTAVQTPKPKVNVVKPAASQATPLSIDDLLNQKINDMVDKEYGGELEQYQTAGQVTGEKEFVEVVTLPDGSKGKRITRGNSVSIVDATGNVLGSKNIEPNFRTINPEKIQQLKEKGIDINVPSRYEGKEWSDTPGRQGVREGQGTYGVEDYYNQENKSDFSKRQSRFLEAYPNFNPKTDSGVFQGWYNNDIYNQAIKAGYNQQEAQDLVNQFGFVKGSKDPNAMDEKFGHYTWSRPSINIKPKPTPPEEPREEVPPGELVPPPPVRRRPIGFYPQDVLNAATAFGDLAGINKYNPRMVQFNAEPMKPTYYDPNRELANNAEMVNMAAQQLAQFTGPQAFNSRFSDVQGKGLANAANIESKYNNLNVGVANQFEQANKQLINETNFRNQLAANDFYDKSVVANQQYDNARRQGRRQSVDYINAALENRFMTDQMNSLYPNYFVDPAYLKTYYTPGRQITPQKKGQDMMTYLESTGIPFDFTDPAVQAALLKGIMGDVNVDERGNIATAQAGLAKRRGKTS